MTINNALHPEVVTGQPDGSAPCAILVNRHNQIQAIVSGWCDEYACLEAMPGYQWVYGWEIAGAYFTSNQPAKVYSHQRACIRYAILEASRYLCDRWQKQSLHAIKWYARHWNRYDPNAEFISYPVDEDTLVAGGMYDDMTGEFIPVSEM